MRALVLATLIASTSALAAAGTPPGEYVPAPAKDIPGYSEERFNCSLEEGWKTTAGRFVSKAQHDEEKELDGPRDSFSPPPGSLHTYMTCYGKTPDLPELSLRELAILRNTIHARYGWAGFRKAWLREHFQKQPWYKP
ncbi:MAG TPA: YARHG domain-containing protein, partial [Myxococcaceae bacterium]|nr:YARHG domain-containing protein [Myxococcaceae bacterium]